MIAQLVELSFWIVGLWDVKRTGYQFVNGDRWCTDQPVQFSQRHRYPAMNWLMCCQLVVGIRIDPMFGSTHGLKLVIPRVKLYCITRMFVCRTQASWLNCTHWHSTLRNTKYHRDQKFCWCVSSCCPRLPVTSYEKAFETSTKMLLGGSHSMTGQQAWPDLASPRFRESPWTIQSTWWATALLVA